ncbi:MAG TPA: TIGR02587 family membrane protein [Chloroflexaceae bacterium]|nr:TIGR02587 family membrane protein [Chloroflexaceae bacterium]
MSTQAQQNPWARELDDLMRGASGGFLFSIPLLYTMEVWWIGTVVSPPRMALALLGACAIVFLLTLTGGFRREEQGKFSDALLETVESVGFSLLFSAAMLALLRRVTLSTPLDEAVGTIIYGALPFAVGMALGNQLLSGARDEEGEGEGRQGDNGADERGATLKDLGASAIGAVFIAFSIAPTEEIPMLAAALTPPWLLTMIAASLLISYMIVFESGFADEAGRHQQRGVLQSPLSETVASYLVALAASALMLVLYDQVRLDDPWPVWLSHTLVLGLPAAVGGAAGRLAV